MRVEGLLSAPETDPRFRPVVIDKDEALLVLFNPQSSEAVAHAKHMRLTAMSEWPGGPVFVEPSESTVEATAEQIIDISQLGEFKLASLGGDGTASKDIRALRLSGVDTDLAVSADGNASDLGHTLNARRYRQDPIGALKFGQVGEVYPLAVTVTNPNGNTQTVEAINYNGIGLTADLGYFFDSMAYRAYRLKHQDDSRFKQWFREVRISNHYLPFARPFTLTDPSGGERLCYEYLVLNGARIAKTRLRGHEYIFERYASIGELSEPKRTKVAKTIAGMAFDGLLSKVNAVKAGEGTSVRVNYDGDRPILMQHDGDWLELENGAEVSFAISDKPSAVVKTRR